MFSLIRWTYLSAGVGQIIMRGNFQGAYDKEILLDNIIIKTYVLTLADIELRVPQIGQVGKDGFVYTSISPSPPSYYLGILGDIVLFFSVGEYHKLQKLITTTLLNL